MRTSLTSSPAVSPTSQIRWEPDVFARTVKEQAAMAPLLITGLSHLAGKTGLRRGGAYYFVDDIVGVEDLSAENPRLAVELTSVFDPEILRYRAYLTRVVVQIRPPAEIDLRYRHSRIRALMTAYAPRYTTTTWDRFTTAAIELARTPGV